LDDHTFFLLRETDQKIRHAGCLVEQQRLHMLTVHPSRQEPERRKLNALVAAYTRLHNYRRALLVEPARTYMH
jgi:hypothetical protein